ncbi:uncharacterized protein IUM83_05561 [Phytophthora cinnamomi]|uniref:uncharacterized protein n=1 Tax=Phytophthora cinnamomi TaxID=4785 RepID=UPI0035596282|nr:hypothetical protein IUM83_05561 [Phytophthora cinnamomi]
MATSAEDGAQLEGVVLAALDSLYQPHLTNPEATRAADAFLRGFQLTPAAFSVCASLLDQLLPENSTAALNSDSVPAVFFSAQTLANKLRRQASTSSCDYAGWSTRIVTWLSSSAKLPKMVVTQLLLALVATLPRLQPQDLKLQDAQSSANSPSQLLALVQESYAQCNGQSVVGYALLHLAQHGVPPSVLAELLLLLVEEADALAERSLRQRMQDEVDAWAPAVLDRLLPQVMHEANSNRSVEAQETGLRALTSWLRYVRVDAEVVVRNPLLHSLLGFLARDELFDASVDLAVEVVHSYAHQNLVVQWLAPRIFTEMGEAYLELLLQQHAAGNDHAALVDLLLDCMSCPDAEVADVTIPFWFRLLQGLQHRVTPALMAQYKPRLERLASLCMQKLQFREEFPSLPVDKQQDFRASARNWGHPARLLPATGS